MLDKRTASIILLIVGSGLLVISLSADLIGIGDDAGFGSQQLMGTITATVLLAAGLALTANGWGAIKTVVSRLLRVEET